MAHSLHQNPQIAAFLSLAFNLKRLHFVLPPHNLSNKLLIKVDDAKIPYLGNKRVSPLLRECRLVYDDSLVVHLQF